VGLSLQREQGPFYSEGTLFWIVVTTCKFPPVLSPTLFFFTSSPLPQYAGCISVICVYLGPFVQ
jgi:hypothetical protein